MSGKSHKDWVLQQKKVFLGFVNLYLKRRGMQVNDLGDPPGLRDGVALCFLVEELSGKKLPIKPVLNPTQRFQKLQNISVAIKFILDQGIRLVGCGAEDILEGNLKLTLGLIWTLIQKFQIQTGVTSAFQAQAQVESEEKRDSSTIKSGGNGTLRKGQATAIRKGAGAKELLLTWVSEQLGAYEHLNVSNLSNDWQNGVLFLHLVHSARPDLVDLDAIDENDKRGNLQLAFDLASDHLGIPKLLDVDDLLDSSKIDEQSVMTYLSLFPTKFNELGVIPGVISKSDEAAKKSKKGKESKKEEGKAPLNFQIAPVEEDYEPESVGNPPLIPSTHPEKVTSAHVELESEPLVAASPPVFDTPDEASRDGIQKATRKKASSSKHEPTVTTKATTMLVPLRKGSKMKVFSLKVIREIQDSQ